MDEPTLRDVERWKDKIEVRLDNRQVFFLFFGSALVACLLFVLGVIVGKRLESRGLAAAPEIEDPLALLDQVAANPEEADDLTFPRALITGAKSANRKKAPAPAVIVEQEAEDAAEDGDDADATAKTQKAEAQKLATVKAEATAKALAEKQTLEQDKAKQEALAKAVAAKEKQESADLAKAQKDADKKAAAAAADAAKKAAATFKGSSGAKGKFALQIGAFQSRDEAEAFASKYQDSSPYVVESNVPGKGMWFRVRVGNFETNTEAMEAKTKFEKQNKIIAYVAPR